MKARQLSSQKDSINSRSKTQPSVLLQQQNKKSSQQKSREQKFKLDIWINISKRQKDFDQERENLYNLDPQKIQIRSKNTFVQENLGSVISLIPNKPNKLIFNSVKKQKLIPFSFNKIFASQNSLSHTLQIAENIDILHYLQQDQLNCCLMVYGSAESEIKTLCSGNSNVEGLFFKILSNFHEKLSKLINKEKNNCKLVANFLAVQDQSVYDLISANQISLMDHPQNGLIFNSAKAYIIENSYQLYTTLRLIFMNKNKMFPQSQLVIQVQVKKYDEKHQSEDFSEKFKPLVGKKVILIQWEKNINRPENNNQNKNKNGSLLSLNQCILEVYKHMEIQKKGLKNQKLNFACFRNSKITRILKPFLTLPSKTIIIGSISSEEKQQSETYQTLMLCNHFSKIQIIQIPQKALRQQIFFEERKEKSTIKEDNNNERYIINNFDSIKSRKKKIQSILQKQRIKIEEAPINVVLKESEEVEQQLNEVRNKIDMTQLKIRNKKFWNLYSRFPDINKKKRLEQDLEQSELIKLEEKQKEIDEEKLRKQAKIYEEIHKLRNEKERQKAVKRYYQIQLSNHSKKANIFLSNQRKMQKEYQQQIQIIDENLKNKKMFGKIKNKKIKTEQFESLIQQEDKLNLQQKQMKGAKSIKSTNKKSNISIFSTKKINYLQKSFQTCPRKSQNIKIEASINYDNEEININEIKLSKSLQRRKKQIRKKVQKGRVEVNRFLLNNIEKYQDYENSIKKNKKQIIRT